MNEKQESRLQFFPAILLLGLMAILIVTAFILLSGIPEPALLQPRSRIPGAEVLMTPSDTPTETITTSPTTTPRPSWTLQSSMTPTLTLTPTWTVSPTRERMPTLTPARPFRFNDRYEFAPMSAELMDRIVRTIADYPVGQFRTAESRLDPAYNAYFIYPFLAYQEALLRFPNAPQATRWQWGLAYSMARIGDPQAVSLYRQLISQALDQENIPANSLADWFSRLTQDLTLQAYELQLTTGQAKLFLLEIPEGNVYYLLDPQAEGPDRLNPLSQRFDFQNGGRGAHTTLDLDGDGSNELVLYLPEPDGLSTITEPSIFNLEGTTPQALEVSELLPFDYQMDTSVSLASRHPGEGNAQVLELNAHFFPACPFTVTLQYQWDEERDGVIQTGPFEYRLEPLQETLSYCEPLLNHALAFWPLGARKNIEETLLPLWPAQADPQGRPYPASAQDELRFKYGLTLALMDYPDHITEAQEILKELVNAPNAPDGPWVQSAQEFLDALGNGSGLYTACQNTPECDLRQALQHIIVEEDASQAVAALPQSGVMVRASGLFDFEQDGISERWLVIRPRPSSDLEFWILVETSTGIQAVFVELVARNDPRPFLADPEVYPGVFQIKNSEGFRMHRLGQDSRVYLEPVDVQPVLTTYTRDGTFAAEEALLGGESPAEVRQELLSVLESGRFNCINHRVCDRFLYILGLAYELAGNTTEARDTYIQLWWENSRSPLTAMARMKLNFIAPAATPTRTAIATSTISPTATTAAAMTTTTTPTATLTATP